MRYRLQLTSLLTGLLCASAWAAGSNARLDQETASIKQWRVERLTNLTSETGWLTLTGLFWLQPGDNSFGRTSSNKLVLDHPDLGERLGVFSLRQGKLLFSADASAKVTVNNKPVSRIELVPDTDGDATTLSVGSLRIFAIKRVNNLGLRVRDVARPARTAFQGLDYFPISTNWLIDARFDAYKPHKRIPVVNVLGMTDQMESPGALVFNKDGRQWRLDTLLEAATDTELFVMFTDKTSAHETYGAGRYLYVPLAKAGRVTVDFNKAYNPPCAFTEFATCALPPKQNRLQLAVTAGEKKPAGH
jgi:uncharacterized protein (DUF1684 family)